MNLHFQKGDCIAIALVLVLAAAVGIACLRPTDAGATVEIRQNGQLVQTLPLSADASYTVTGAYTNVITVHGGRVSVTDTTCPGADCMHTRAISAVGRCIVCLPNGVEVRIVGASDGVDFVLG